MREITVGTNEKGQRLDKLLVKLLPLAPKSFIYRMLRKKNITVNDGKASGDEIIKEGDLIKLWLSEDTIEKFSSDRKGRSFDAVPDFDRNRIVYEDEDILVYDKPAGLLSQKAAADDISVNDMLLKYTGGGSDTFTPSICNRLDRNTSGLIICGKTLGGLQMISSQLQSHSLKKDYLAIVEGRLTEGGEIITEADGKKLHSEVRPIACTSRGTAVMVRIYTGKTHQVRIHMSRIGHPIIGDRRYGNTNAGTDAKRQLLHSYRIRLSDGRRFEASIPEDFRWELGKPEDFEDLPLKI